MRNKNESITLSRIHILAGLLVLAGCGQAQDSSAINADSPASDQSSLVATTSLSDAPAHSDACAALDPNAAILSSGFGLNPGNTRNAVSRINASNIDRLRLRFALGGPVQEKRGAPAVTEQALFYYVGNQVVAASRSTGCTFWTVTLTNPAAAEDVLRSSSLLLVDNPSGGRMLFVGSARGLVYGLDAADGSTVWSAGVSTEPMHILTGGMQFSDGRLFVPVATGEVILAGKPVRRAAEATASSSHSTRSTVM